MKFTFIPHISIHTLHVSQRVVHRVHNEYQGENYLKHWLLIRFLKKGSHIPQAALILIQAETVLEVLILLPPPPRVLGLQACITTTKNNIVIVRLCSLRGRPSRLASWHHTQEFQDQTGTKQNIISQKRKRQMLYALTGTLWVLPIAWKDVEFTLCLKHIQSCSNHCTCSLLICKKHQKVSLLFLVAVSAQVCGIFSMFELIHFSLYPYISWL